MQIGKKLFPYPVLNKISEYSCYKDTNYSLKCEDYQEGEYYIFENTYIEMENEEIKEMISNNILGVALVIECSETIYREVIPISLEPNTYKIKSGNLRGLVVVSCYIYAKQDIDSYTNQNLLEDYAGYEFHIDKNDIVAIDDGFRMQIEYDKDLDKKVSSIFQVIRNSNINHMIIENKMNKIVISLPDEEFGYYDALRKNDNFQNIFFSMLAIPALAYCLKEFQYNIKAEKYELDDVEINYIWFHSVKNAYHKLYQEELTEEKFKNIEVIELAQKLLNNGSLEGIKDLFNFVMQKNYGGDEDE